MAVKLRMTRIGRRHRPFFRINAIESREPRDGKILEKLGHYDPIEKDPAKQVVINLERVKYWLDKGAIPSDAVSQILLRQGVKTRYAEEKTARRARAKAAARAKGKFFTKAEKIAAEKATEERAKTEEQAKAQEEAKPKETEEKPKAEDKTKPANEEEKSASDENKSNSDAG